MEIEIGQMSAADWDSVAGIYADGIATGQATFQTSVPTWEQWDKAHLPNCRLVARGIDDGLYGWAALLPVSARPVYAGVAEVSIYIASAARGKGVGKRLLNALITESEKDGRWTLQAGIFPENEASVAMHLACGFRIVGRRARIGCHHGVWRDNLLLERRSSVVGV
ncbi:MAG TPA: GNAT family N-acetyltransferase [Gemmatimonadaceae bacterium]|nr:GNAT family N-acetyltransferase [Gemmatimonadaceae bacterium]